MPLIETNRYHFADVTLDLADRSTRQLAVKVDGIQGARAVQRLQRLALPDDKTKPLDADELRLKGLLTKHAIPETAIIQRLDRVRRRIQLDHDPKQGHDEIDLTKPLPKSMPGEIRRAIHLCIEYKDGRTEIKPPAITASAARRALEEAKADSGVARAYVAMRIVTEEDATGEL